MSNKIHWHFENIIVKLYKCDTHENVGTGPHQVLADMLTLFKSGVLPTSTTYACYCQVLKAAGVHD